MSYRFLLHIRPHWKKLQQILFFTYRVKGYDLKSYRQILVKEGFKQDELRPEIKRRMYKLEDDSIEKANEKLVSFTFVRDPYDRLVSCYYNKMIMTNWFKIHQDLRWMRDEILTK